MHKYIIFRNDDVRGTLDNSLVEITNLFIKYQIPITHVIEPANVSDEVANWLLDLKLKHPGLIEIGQHGYDHKLKNDERPGEFGGKRTYQEQFQEISKGKELMDEKFGNLWFPVFTFPYGGANDGAYKAIDDCSFKVVNGGYGIDLQRRLFYLAGHLLRRNFLFKKRIPYDLKIKPKTNLFEINMSFGFIKKYISDDTDSIMQPLDEMKRKTEEYLKSDRKAIGVLLHHRYHIDTQKIKLVEDYLKWVKKIPNIDFVTQEYIYNLYK